MKNRSAGIVLSYINTGLNMVTGLFLSAFLLRILGNVEYGIYKTISSFATYLVLFEFGTGTVMTRNLSMCRARKADDEEIARNISTVWTITNVLAAGIVVAAIVFYCFLGRIYSNALTCEQIAYGRQMFLFIAVYIIAGFYSQTLGGIVLANEYYTYSAKVSIVRISVRTLALTGMVYFCRYAIVIAAVDMILYVAILVYNVFFCVKKCHVSFTFRKFDKDIFREALPLSLAIFLQVIVNQANNNVDVFLIGIKLRPEDVSLYSVGLYIYSMFSSLTTIPIALYAPKIMKDVSIGLRKKELTDTLIQPSRLIVLIGGTVLFGFISVGRQFIEIVYGKAYLQAWVIALLIMIPMYINMANGVLVNVLDAMNKRMVRSKVLIVTTIANVVLTIFWLDIWGIVGAAAATAICTLVGQVLVMNIYYSQELEIKVLYLFQKTFQGILPFQIVGMAAALLVGTFIQNQYVSFLAGGVLFASISFGLFAGCGTNETEKTMIHRNLKKLRLLR